MIKTSSFKDKTVLITGGTGSYGKFLTNYLYENKFKFKKLIIFSRDELKQHEMSKFHLEKNRENIRFILGDIRESEGLKRALKEVDIVFHAAALKQVPKAEYNPFEYIKTNIIGAQTLIDSVLETGVSNVIALSTDKASSPINLYGATKLCSDKLFVAAQNITGKKNKKFKVFKYCNVLGSRGSILPLFKEQLKKNNCITITDKRMTRFNITLDQAILFSLNSFSISRGGEIFVPKLSSFKVKDFIKAMSSNCKIIETGIRPGEKLHEEMISKEDALNI